MTPLLRKHILKAADIFLGLKPGHSPWPVKIIEPITIPFCYPYLSLSLWEVRHSKALLELGRYVHVVWENYQDEEVYLLYKICKLKERASALLPVMESIMLQGLQKVKISHSTSIKLQRI